MKAFGIIGLIIGLLGLGVLAWWGCSFLSLRKMRNQFDNYDVLVEAPEIQ